MAKISTYVDTCTGLTDSCAAALSIDAWSQVSSSCFLDIKPYAFRLLTSQQVAVMPFQYFDRISSDQLKGFSSPGCTGFTSNHFSKLATGDYNSDACGGIQPSCIKAILSSVFSGLNGKCAGSLSTAALGALSWDQVNAMPDDPFAVIDSTHIAAINVSACAGFKSTQFQKLATGPYNNDACSGFRSDCIAVVPVDAFSGLSVACAKFITGLSGLGHDQLAVIPDATIAVLDSTQLTSLNASACSGFTGPQLKQLATGDYNSDACSGIQAECSRHIPSLALQQISASCANFISASALAVFSKDQIANFNVKAFQNLGSTQLSLLKSQSCSGITANQMAVLASGSYVSDACSGFTSDCISGILPTSMASISDLCIEFISAAAMSGMTAPQISSIMAHSVSLLDSSQLAGLSPSACSGFTGDQITAFGTGTYAAGACSGLQGACLASFSSSDLFSRFTRNCINDLHSDVFKSTSKADVLAISTDGMSGMTGSHFYSIVTTLGSGIADEFSSDKLAQVDLEEISFFHSYYFNTGYLRPDSSRTTMNLSWNWLQLSFAVDSSASSITANAYKSLSTHVHLSGLRAGHTPNIPDELFAALTEINVFASDFVSAITVSQIRNTSCEAFESSFPYVDYLSHQNGALQNVTPKQLYALFSTALFYEAALLDCQRFLQYLSNPQRLAMIQAGLDVDFDKCPYRSPITAQFSEADQGVCKGAPLPGPTHATFNPVTFNPPPSGGGTGTGGGHGGGTGTGGGNGGSSSEWIIPVVLSVVVVSGIVGFAFWKRRQAANNYQAIPSGP